MPAGTAATPLPLPLPAWPAPVGVGNPQICDSEASAGGGVLRAARAVWVRARPSVARLEQQG